MGGKGNSPFVTSVYERLSFVNVVWVGANEVNRRRGRNYLMVFADLIANRELFATPRKNSSFSEYLLRNCNGACTIPKLQPVVIEMSWASPKWVNDNCGTARLVHDNFQVIQNFVVICNKIRKASNRK
jgi:hypothetical protein